MITNQRPAAERAPGPFEGPSSYTQLCWWSLILRPINKLLGNSGSHPSQLNPKIFEILVSNKREWIALD